MPSFLDQRAEDAAAYVPNFGYFNDFIRSDDVVTVGGVTYAAIGTGPLAASAVNGGWVTIISAATDDNGGAGYVLPGFTFAPSKDLALKGRIAVSRTSTINDCSWLFGMSTAVVPLASGAETTTNAFGGILLVDAVYFFKAEGATTVSCCIVTTNKGTTKTALFTVPTAVFGSAGLASGDIHTYGINIHPVGVVSSLNRGNVEWTVDGKSVFVATNTELPLLTTIQTPIFGVITRVAGVAVTMAIDYIGCLQTR